MHACPRSLKVQSLVHPPHVSGAHRSASQPSLQLPLQLPHVALQIQLPPLQDAFCPQAVHE